MNREEQMKKIRKPRRDWSLYRNRLNWSLRWLAERPAYTLTLDDLHN